MTYTHPPAKNFDELDPHGYQAGHKHHGHHIISGFVLKAVLIVLLVLTVLTVGQAQLEQYIVGTFDIALPRWVNVAVVMAIAVVKGCLVVLFFMGLRYDNPMNAVVLCFTLFGVGLFLGFTMGDLNARGAIYEYKKGEIIHGGIGNITRTIEGKLDTVPGGTPIVEHVRKNKITELGLRKLKELGLDEQKDADKIEPLGLEEYAKLEALIAHHGHHDDHHDDINTASRTRHRAGRTHGLFDAANPTSSHEPGDHGGAGHDDHGDKAGAKTGEKHAEPAGKGGH